MIARGIDTWVFSAAVVQHHHLFKSCCHIFRPRRALARERGAIISIDSVLFRAVIRRRRIIYAVALLARNKMAERERERECSFLYLFIKRAAPFLFMYLPLVPELMAVCLSAVRFNDSPASSALSAPTKRQLNGTLNATRLISIKCNTAVWRDVNG